MEPSKPQPISPPRPQHLLSPLLASLHAASISPSPPPALLPLLSPILRQRVQLLVTDRGEGWLGLLCYDEKKGRELRKIAGDARLEMHPVSGEVEVDWDAEVAIAYRRIDEETLHSLIALRELGLEVKLVWCVNDAEGGPPNDGWRIGEVGVVEKRDGSWGHETIDEAEEAFETETHANHHLVSHHLTNGTNGLNAGVQEEEDDDDDDYWAQYDNTPARTPAAKRSPAPPANQLDMLAHVDADADEDEYYAQYAQVQPALDNDDPDEVARNGDVESTLGGKGLGNAGGQKQVEHMKSFETEEGRETKDSTLTWSLVNSVNSGSLDSSCSPILHPRPSSSSGSSGSETVAKLERLVGAGEVVNGNGKELEKKAGLTSRELSEVGIRQHIATSVKSLYRLARVAGIEKAEFERIVHTEVECLGLWDEEEG